MPELPELEVLREYLGPRVEGRKIAQVWTSPKLSFLLRTPPDEYARQLNGGTFQRVWRRGKFVIFDISGRHRLSDHARRWGRAPLPRSREDGPRLLGGTGGAADDPGLGGTRPGCADG